MMLLDHIIKNVWKIVIGKIEKHKLYLHVTWNRRIIEVENKDNENLVEFSHFYSHLSIYFQ